MQDRDLGRIKSKRLPLRAQWLAAGMTAASVVATACGGGDGKSAKTPEVAGTLGATNTPTAGATIRPTETPTATPANTEVLSPQELLSAGIELSGIFAEAFKGLDVSAIGYDKVSQPVERDLQSVQNAIGICTGAVPFPYRDEAERQRAAQDVTLLATGVSGFCEIAGESSLGFYNALDNDPARQAQFKQANMQMEKIHYSVIKDFQEQDSRIKNGAWLSLKARFYPFGTGTSN